MTRLFTRKQRRYLSILSGGRCNLCGIPLPRSFHADHVHPWAHGGETTLHNGQALCPSCNLQKGAKLMPGTPTLRSWQQEAFEDLTDAWETPDSKPLIAACPGAGKTWFSVFSSQYAIRNHDIELVLVVTPSINIKEQWCETFKTAGIQAFAKADNESLRFRIDNNLNPTEDYRAICITYSQLSKDIGLFIEIAKRKKTLVIADEVHHADDRESFGRALEYLAEQATLRLALSGTPFNSSGGALAMCNSEDTLDAFDRAVRKAVATKSYSYGDAIREHSCRPAEFIKVVGKGVSIHRTLSSNEIWKKTIDLAKENKTDSLGPLLDPEGGFFLKMATDALTALEDIKRVDSKAGMLIVAKDRQHGKKICETIESLCRANRQWRDYNTLEIYNDTPKAHERIKQLDRDLTDIVITVRMISEGVDVKRLRVGLYATDYRTRMFFIQFVGRFIRWEDRLDDTQHAKIVIPAHPDLILFAREIEKMVDQALISLESGEGGEAAERKNECLGTESEASESSVIWRGEEDSDRALANQFFEQFPDLRGQLPEAMAIKAMKNANLGDATESKPVQVEEDWGRKNDQLVRRIVQFQSAFNSDDAKAYQRINSKANQAVGIKRKDKMTPVNVLKRRHAFLLSWLRKLNDGQPLEGV